MPDAQPLGSISWADLTIPNAEEVRDFYQAVVGWTAAPVEMGGYEDFCMNAADGRTVVGVCHARGPNAGLPPQWLIYITVADLDASLEQCLRLGGKVVAGPRNAGGSRIAVIEDPAGAVAALCEQK